MMTNHIQKYLLLLLMISFFPLHTYSQIERDIFFKENVLLNNKTKELVKGLENYDFYKDITIASYDSILVIGSIKRRMTNYGFIFNSDEELLIILSFQDTASINGKSVQILTFHKERIISIVTYYNGKLDFISGINPLDSMITHKNTLLPKKKLKEYQDLSKLDISSVIKLSLNIEDRLVNNNSLIKYEKMNCFNVFISEIDNRCHPSN